jgi:hypothetical protein
MTLIGNFPKENEFIPKPFGPTFDWQGDNNIIILDGKLKGQKLFIEKEFTGKTAQIKLYLQEDRIAHCLVEYEKDSFVEIWDIVVDEKHRQSGLASLVTKILVREMLFKQNTTRIKLKMVKLFRPDEKEIKLINVGSGIIAHKLGTTCEFDIERLILEQHVSNIEVIPPTGKNPPAYKIILDVFPYMLISFIVDSTTEKAIFDYEIYSRFRSQFEVIIDWSRHRQLIIGNANYFLYEDGIDDFIRCIALNKAEAELLYPRILGIKQ